MSLDDLRKAHNKRGGPAREAINRAIRAELVGGNEALDALTKLHEMQHAIIRRGMPQREIDICQVAMERIAGIVAAMESEIRRRYQLGGKDV